MSPSEQRSLFQAFGKLKRSKAINQQGCGLGLMISKTLVQAMGGTICVRSYKDIGSKFMVFLPLRVDVASTEVEIWGRSKMETMADMVNQSESNLKLESSKTEMPGLKVMPTQEAKFMGDTIPSERMLLKTQSHNRRECVLIVDDDTFN